MPGAALLLLAALGAASDTTIFADTATQLLVERGIARHGVQDSVVRDYAATFRYRLSFGLGRRRWASVPNAAVEEQDGTLQWAAPNDLRVEILGRRVAARSSNLRPNSSFDQPWFIPRTLTDSLRVFGNDVPSRAALHPLAADGPEWYRYRIIDSVQLSTPDGHRVKLLAVEVTPRKVGESLIAGRLWLDAASADLVRFSFRFVGTALWLDKDEDLDGNEKWARRGNQLINQILTLNGDLEYALQDGTHWMPYRQVVSGRVELPWFGELVVPFEARTTFDNYEINRGQPIPFTVVLPPEVTDPDSVRALVRARRDSIREEHRRRREEEGNLPDDEAARNAEARDDAGRWPGGRFEIHRAPFDSLKAYSAWGDSLVLDDDPATDREVRQVEADLERLSAGLESELTGRRTHGFAWERLTEIIRYNRVQGFAPGFGYDVRLPGDGFTTLRGDLRYGFSDERLTGGLTIVREAPGARWTLRGLREVTSNDPFARANTFSNSLNAIFGAHDDADYHLAQGGRLTREGSVGTGLELTTALSVEHYSSVTREGHSWMNDALGGSGDFPDNPPVTEGVFGGASMRLDGGALRGRWSVAMDVLADDSAATGRLSASLKGPLWGGPRALQLAVRTGVTTNDPLPQQAFRIGGLGTVRGFDYGTHRGQAFWAVQADLPLGRGALKPFLFADAGQAAAEVGDLFSSSVLAGGGAGLAVLGFLRFDLSYPITGGGDGFRFDMSVRSLLP